MKGFHWQPESRPKDRKDISPLELRRSERTRYLARSMPRFNETERYFPGHMKSIAKKLAAADSLRRVRHAEARERQALAEQEAALAAQDSLAAAPADSTLAVPKDSLAAPAAPKDSLAARTGQEGAVQPADSLAAGPGAAAAVEPVHVPTAEELKAARKAEAEAKRQARGVAR